VEFRSVDPYDHPIDVHTYPDWKEKVYPALIRSDTSKVTGASLQCKFPEQINAEVAEWIAKSAGSANPFVVSNDEQGLSWLGTMTVSSLPESTRIQPAFLTQAWTSI